MVNIVDRLNIGYVEHVGTVFSYFMSRKIVLISCVLLLASAIQAEDIIVCDFNGTEPSSNTPWTQVSYLDPNLGFTGWQLGAGAHPTAGVDDAFGFYVIATSSGSDLAEAIVDDEYIYFTLQPTSGALNLNGKKINFGIQRIDWHAPQQYSVFTSIDGFTESDALFTTATADNGNYDDIHHSFITPPTGYNGIIVSVEFRIYAHQARYSGHDTKLTAFSIEQSAPVFALAVNSSVGGSATSNPQGTIFEQGTVIQLIAEPEPGYHFSGWSGDITGMGNPRIITIDLNTAVTANFEQNPPAGMEVGTNVAGTQDWSTEWDFVDMFKMSRVWLTREVGSYDWESGKQDEIPLDANGWPIVLPFTAGDGNDHYVHTIMPAFVPGDYTVIVEGIGEIEFKNAATGHFYPNGGTNSYNITVPVGKEGPTALFVNILESSSGDPIRNLRVIMPGFQSTYLEQPFHSIFLQRLEPFACIRFMDWAKTNASPLTLWSQRTKPDTYTQTREEGVALEYMIQLANTLDKDIWVCIPHLADDDYVMQCARLLRDTVEPELKIYVEYSNETWNGMFLQTGYVQDMGLALGLDTEGWVAGQKYVSLRSVQIWEIFEDEFIDDSRLIKVMATQSANIWITNIRFDALNDPIINPDYLMPDALAIAPYFGKNFTADDIPPAAPDYPTVDEILEIVAPAEIANVQNHVIAQKAVADAQGCQLICYEGGQHFVGVHDTTLTNILTSANRDPRMYERYYEYLDMLKAEGVDTFAHYHYVGPFNQWGSWGSLEYQDEPIEEAHKYRTLIDWINANPVICGDLDGNSRIDWQDLRIFTEDWLETGGNANLDGIDGVNFCDYALLSHNWGL